MDSSPSPALGLAAPGVLDALVHEATTGRVILVMFERRPWTGGDTQLWQLQEKLNAYVSYALDGEFQEDHPELIGLPLCLQLRTVHPPSPRALEMLQQVRRQLEFMEIALEIWEISPDETGSEKP